MPRFRSVKLLIVMIVAVVSIAWFGVAKAFFNPQINYQGKLTNSSDVAVTDGTYNMQFSLCADSACSSVLWTEVRTSTNKVQVTNGVFSVLLGEVATTSLFGVDFNQDIYLELQVGGTSTPSFEILLPRKRFGAVPNAFNTAKLGGKTEAQFGTLAENEIVTGAWNFNNILSITANSSSPALSILQSGTGTGISVGNGVATTTIFGASTSTFPYGATFATTGGNVGIGTTTPVTKLQILATTEQLRLNYDALNYSSFTVNNSGGLTIGTTNNATTSITNGLTVNTNTFVVTKAGNVGIGTSNPQSVLDVYSTKVGGDLLNFKNANTADYMLLGVTNNSDKQLALISYGDTQPGTILGNNRGGAAVILGYNNPTSLLIGTYGDQPVVFARNNLEAMRVGASNQIGIGTTAPDKALEINSATGANLRLTYNDNNGAAANFTDFSVGSNGALTISPSNSATTTIANGLVVNTNSLVVNKANGYVGVGNLSPDAMLHIGTGDLAIAGNVATRIEPVWTSNLGGFDRVFLFHPIFNYNVGTNVIGMQLMPEVSTGKTIPSLYNIYISPVANGNITTNYGLYIDAKTGAGTITNNYDAIFNGGGTVGIGTTTPVAKLQVLSTTEQLRLNYDASNYASFTVNSSGGLTIGTTNNATTTIANGLVVNTNSLVVNKANGYIGIGTLNPISILSNSALNASDYRGYGVQLGSGMVWKANGAGYGIAFEQLGTGAARNGALFKTASIDPDATVFVAESNSIGRIVARADGYVGFNIATDYSGISANYTFNQLAKTSGSPTMLLLTAAAHTTLAASTEAIDLNFNLARTVQFSTGNLVTQRAAVLQAPTYGAVGASTIINAATFAITGAPVAGANMTITKPLAFWVQSGKSRFDGDLSVTGSISIGTTTISEKLRVYDGTLLVDSPVHPTLLGSYDTTGTVYAVDVSGKYAYVADGASGLEIFEISNPTNPALIGYYDTVGEARDVKIVGKYAYVADNSDGLLIFDISAPAAPILVGSYNTPVAAIGVSISGKYAYVADISSLIVVDISNPRNPTLAAQLATVSPIKVYVAGEYAYLAKNTGGSGGGLSIVNISNPLNPVLASTTATTLNSMDVYASGRYAYLANGDNNNVLVYDVSVPTAPVLSLTLSTVGSVRGVFAAGNYVYVNDTSTFYIYNAATGGNLVGSYAINEGYSLKIIGKHAYVANGTFGLSVIDIKGADISSANIGTIATNDLTVWENADFGNNVSIRNGLNIGSGGMLSNGAVAITVSTTISTTTLFSVGTSTPLFMVSADGSVRINTTSTPVANYKLMVDSGSSTSAGIGVNGYIKASGFITGTTTLDLAETYPFDLSCVGRGDCPVNADLVCVDPLLSTGVKKCSATSTESMVGVVSTNPGFLLGGSEFGDLQATNTAKIALSGRVPVKVSIASGTIKIGDELTVGAIDGSVQKALDPGQIIGVALENFGKENESYPQTGTVLVFVNPHWSIGSLEVKDIPNDLPDFTSTTPSILDKFTLAIENSLQKLGLVIKNGVAKLKELFVDKIFTKQLCVGETCIGEQQLKDILQNTQVSPTVQTVPIVNTQSFAPPVVLNDTTSSFSAITATVPLVDNTTTAIVQTSPPIASTDTTTVVTSVTPSI